MCREKRDAASGTVEEDEAMIDGIAVERLVIDEDCMLGGLLK